MKRFNLSKELFFGSVLIGVLSLGLASCGGGGGGGGSGSTSQPSGGTTSPSSLSFGSYIYQGTDWQNEPIITVYIDGQPVQLLVDTGESGFLVNQSAVNIPSSDYMSSTFSGTYGDGSYVSGVFASATVCLNPSITYTCVVMPIGVNISGTAFQSSSEAQGDFGLLSGFGSVENSGTIFSGSSFSPFTDPSSYVYYLAQEYGINSFTIEFYPLSNTFYAYVSSSTPIGEISFGTNAPSTYLPYWPAAVVFPSYTSSISSFSSFAYFDTSANFNFLSTNALYREIPNLSSSDENNCLSGSVPLIGHYGAGGSVVNGGFNIAYQLLTNFFDSTTVYSATFTTEPPTWFCSSGVQWNLMIGNTVDVGPVAAVGYHEIFGLPEMLSHTFVWVLDDGYVQGISINP